MDANEFLQEVKRMGEQVTQDVIGDPDVSKLYFMVMDSNVPMGVAIDQLAEFKRRSPDNFEQLITALANINKRLSDVGNAAHAHGLI